MAPLFLRGVLFPFALQSYNLFFILPNFFSSFLFVSVCRCCLCSMYQCFIFVYFFIDKCVSVTFLPHMKRFDNSFAVGFSLLRTAHQRTFHPFTLQTTPQAAHKTTTQIALPNVSSQNSSPDSLPLLQSSSSNVSSPSSLYDVSVSVGGGGTVVGVVLEELFAQMGAVEVKVYFGCGN